MAEIRPGRQAFSFRHADGREESLDMATFGAISKGVRPAPGPGVLSARLPSPLLGDRLCFVDTPGVSSINETHDDITFGYLPKVDAACVVLNGEQGGVPASVLEFLRDRVLRSDVGKLVFVANHLDRKSPGEREAIVGAMAKTLSAYVPSPRIIAASAVGDDPGTDALEKFIANEVRDAAGGILASRAGAHMQAHGRALLSALMAQVSAVESDTDAAIGTKIAEIQRAREELEVQLSRVSGEVRRRTEAARAALPGIIEGAFTNVQHRAEEYVNAKLQAKQPLDGLAEKLRGWAAQELQTALTEGIMPQFRQLEEVIRTEVQSIRASMPAIDVPEFDLSVSTTTVMIVEAILNVVLNFLLPGGWLVAHLARIFGDKFIGPFKEVVLNLVRAMMGQTLNAAVLKAVASAMQEAQDSAVREISPRLAEVEAELSKAVRKHFDGLLAAQANALDAAIDTRRRGESEAKAASKALRAVADEVRALLAGG